MGSIIKNISLSFLKIIGITFLFAVVLITPVDKRDFRNTPFFKTTMDRLDSIKHALNDQKQGPVEIGWGKANITPPLPVRLTGKNWTPYKQVYDSVYLRAFIFSNGFQKIALISYDLWIIHPHLASSMKERIKEAGLGITGVYFTANHSHTSIGGWATGLLGALIVGGNSAQTLDFLGDRTLDALKSANSRLQNVAVGYGEIATEKMVANRIDTAGFLDNKLRLLEMRTYSHEQAIFVTFSAHSVYMNKDINTLSADYPGAFIEALEASDNLDFASFSPGATGSHTPVGRKPFERAKMQAYGEKLADYVFQAQELIQLDTAAVFKYIEWPVSLRSPHFRVSNNWRLRPWLFKALMGKPQPTITALRIANTVLVGLPIELSGEYYVEFQEICNKKDLNLMITSFNGTYLGYVTPEKYYYSLKTAETREMNWYGPQNGEYFVSLIKDLLDNI